MMKKILLTALTLLSIQTFAGKIAYKIEKKGFAKGISGPSNFSQSIFFDITDKEYINSAQLSINLSYSSILRPSSYVKILINDIPLASKDLSTGKNKFAFNRYKNTINIPKSYLSTGALKLTITANAVLSKDQCINTQLAKNLIHILPSTAIHIDYKNQRMNIANTLKSFPEKINIYTDHSYNNHQIFDLIYYLRKFSHKINFIDNPKDIKKNKIHISLASTETNNNLLQLLSNEDRDILAQKDQIESRFVSDNNMILIDTQSRSDTRIYNALVEYRNLLLSKGINLENSKPSSILETKVYRDQLGINEEGKVFNNRQEWNFSINPSQYLGKKQPSSLTVSTTVTPTTGDHPHKLNVFQNNQLIKVVELDNSGRPTLYNFELLPYLKEQTQTIKILIIASDKDGQCGSGSYGAIASLLPDTHVTLKELDQKTDSLAKINYAFKDTIDFFIPKDTSKIAAAYNNYLLSNSYGINPLRINFIEFDNVIPKTKRPFIAITNRNSNTDWLAPIKDSNITTFTTFLKNKIMAIEGLENLSLIQLVNKDGHSGVNFHYLGKSFLSEANYITFDDNDIVMIDKSSEVSRFNSMLLSKELPVFAKSNILEDLYTKYKFILLFGVWLLLTFGFIRLSKRNND